MIGARLCVLAMTFACLCGTPGPSPGDGAQPVIDAHRDEVLATRAQLEVIAASAGSASREGPSEMGEVEQPLDFSTLGSGNAAMLDEADLADLEHPVPGAHCRFTYETKFERPFRLVAHGYLSPVYNDTERGLMEQAFRKLAAVRYVGICRTFEYAEPALVDGEVRQGRQRGDVLLYELASGRRVGHVSFDVTTEHTPELLAREQQWFQGPANHLDVDVWRAIRRAFDAVGAHVFDPAEATP